MSKKVKQNAPEIIFWGIICIIVFITAYAMPYGMYRDHAYLFADAVQMSKGYALYSEVSTLAMPLSLDIVSVIFKIFGPSFRLYKMLGGVYVIAIAFATDQVGRTYQVSTPWRRLMVAFVAAFMITDQFLPSYNELVILFSLLSVAAIKKEQWFLTGLLCGLSVCAKQTTGLVLCGLVYFYVLFRRRKLLGRVLLGIAIPLILVAIRLYPVREAAYDLMVAGPKESFGQNAWCTAMGAYGLLIVLGACEVEVIMLFKEHKPGYAELYMFLCVGLCMAYPILDANHVRMLMLGIVILTCVNLDRKHSILSAAIYLLILIPAALGCKRTIYFEHLRMTYGTTNAKYLEGEVVVPRDFEEVETYLQQQLADGKQIYLISGDGVFYSTASDIYDPLWTDPLHGNIGANEIEKWESAIDSYPAGTLLLVNRAREMWQFPTEIANYARKAGTYIETVGRFEVYEK